MPLATRIVAGLLAASAVMAIAETASADAQACIAANEKGQKLRSSGKLREAREQFVICGDDKCPSLVRHDCSQWNAELQQSLPTVVFGAKDKGSHDLFDVTVSVDGAQLVTKLDGKSVIVDPGKHTFKFESSGMPPVTEVVLVKEGERARNINVVFDGGQGPDPTPTPGPVNVQGGKEQPEEQGHTIPPWILVGIGGAAVVAGIVIFATAPSHPSNCNSETQKCERQPNESDTQLANDKDQAGQADSQPVLGGVIAGVGLALVAGGLIWHFAEPTGPSKSAIRFTPWTTGKSSGFALGGAF